MVNALRLMPMIVVVLAGCRSVAVETATPENVTLSVDAARYAPGDTVELRLDNRTDDRVGYNLCTSALERREGGEWVNVPSDRVCTMELRLLSAGDRATYPLVLERGLPSGTYRASTVVELPVGGARAWIVSETFELRR